MARSFTASSSQFLQPSYSPVSSVLTVAGWVRVPAAAPAANRVIFQFNDGSSSDYLLLIHRSDAFLRLRYLVTNGRNADISSAFTDNQWHFVAAVSNVNKPRLKVWCDKRTGQNNNSETADTWTTSYLGRDFNGNYFDGDMAHFAVWNVDLADEEIGRLYNGGFGLDPSSIRPANCVSYWPFFNNDLNYAYTGRKYDLTPNNGPTFVPGGPIIRRTKTFHIAIPEEEPTPPTGVRVLAVPARSKLVGGKSHFFDFGPALITDCDVASLGQQSTLAVWFKNNESRAQTFFWHGDHETSNTYSAIGLTSSGKLDATNRSAGAYAYTQSTNLFPKNEWSLAIGVWYDPTNVSCFLNGIKTPLIGTTNPPGYTQKQIWIGALGNSSSGANWTRSSLAHAAIYAGALSDSDALRLWNAGQGLDPRLVRRDILLGYWPLVGNFKDYARNYDMNWINSIPTPDTGPLIQSKTHPQYIPIPTAPPTEYTPKYPDIFQSPIIGV